MDKADLRVVNLITDFDCDLNCAGPYADAGAYGVFLYEGDGYCGRGARLSWAGDAPVVGGRAPLWGTRDPVWLARVLRGLPKDARNPDSYSLVPVHVWTHNVSDVISTVKLLGGDYFDVVTPEDFVSRLRANVFHDCAAAVRATGSYTTSCTGGTDTCGVLRDVSCTDGRGHTIPNAFFDHHACPNNAVDNCFGRLQCSGEPCACVGPATGSYTQSCKCAGECGVLTQCVCSGAPVQHAFDYSVCPNLAVADCFGALLCQGQPCA